MNFAVLPPEVNSARIFAGAGLGPMLAAASAWDGLAEELHAAAGSFASVTTGLAGDAWHGPASLAMTRAASPYVGWLNTAAGQAAQAAGQARLAASAFEATLAATVSPAMVAANRTRLASLVAANLLGQNAPAIAAAEAEYEQIWAQDVAAMFGYHSAASAVATQLAPIQEGLQQQLQNVLAQLASGNLGSGNVGVGNIGNDNIGNANIGFGNRGDANIGIGNIGDRNLGIGNTGNWNIGIGITGNGQIGFGKPANPDVLVVGNGGPGVTALIALPPDLASGVVQPVSSPDVLTTYILLPSQDLPLLVPLRAIPLLGNPLADLIQPDLRVLVELGYDRTAHQDVPSPFGLFPDVDWAEVAADLQQGAVQGVNDALSGLGLPPPWQPALPRLF